MKGDPLVGSGAAELDGEEPEEPGYIGTFGKDENWLEE